MARAVVRTHFVRLLTCTLAVSALLGSTIAKAEPRVKLQLNCPGFSTNAFQLGKTDPEVDPCVELGTSLVANLATGVLYVCENGKSLARYDIAIGRGGAGKKSEGDLKTPVGTYVLESPRTSTLFGIFIPIGYPTTAQQQRGYTGDSVGLHGPERARACTGLANVTSNWTEGCLAVADDHFIAELAAFVRSHPGLVIHLQRLDLK